MNSNPLAGFSDRHRLLIDNYLETLLPRPEGPQARLREAMRYGTLNGGKRIRPLLVFATLDALGSDSMPGLPAAAAVELIHSYSLIHDDLPAMDDDDLRRGKPTCHIAYDEATAILVGDALQTLAFQHLAECTAIPADNRLRMIQELAGASGEDGMVGGQAIDLNATGRTLTLPDLETMHLKKTGALIEASIIMGAISTAPLRPVPLDQLRLFARTIGLAFQVRDDIIDVESDSALTGKTQGKDAASNKPTYTSLLGLDGAKAKAAELMESAEAQLEAMHLLDSRLHQLAAFIVERQH